MTEQYDSLGEKTRMIDIAMKYTRGDIVKAKEMAAGQYLDIIVMKGKFLAEKKGMSGIFLAFFNYIQEYIANVTSVISYRPTLFEKTRIFDDWKTLNGDLLAYKQGSDMVDSQNFTYFLIDSFVGYDVFPDVQEQNLDDLTKTVTEIIGKSINSDAVKCQIEMESTNSMELELTGIPIDVPGGKSSELAEITREDERIIKIEREVKYVIDGKAVVAPVHGKNVSDLMPGDKIKVMLTGSDVVSEKIMKLLNSYDVEGERMPITGRVKTKIFFEKGGYLIYAFVAKGVLAKIFEEENVKILLDQPMDEVVSESTIFDKRLIYILGIVVGLIILCGIILFQLL
ncbi:MAG: hypothetical protein A2176_13445 [Spirochaetes bacterium RBG_13_51_14]|nr:MAG: hypothetical protein A2176_13445 [Spirochaetes bacterium RBG_13_51_14]